MTKTLEYQYDYIVRKISKLTMQIGMPTQAMCVKHGHDDNDIVNAPFNR